MNLSKFYEISNDLYLFYRCIIGSKFKENLPAKHIKELSRHLMLNYRGLEKRLVCAMPPRHSKSSMITISYPLWLIFHNPNLHILIVNNSATLSEKFGISLREYVKQYGQIFNVYLSDIKHSNSNMMFEDENGKIYNGSIKLVGAGGSITGEDVDYLIIDDPYKGLIEEFTPSALQKKIDWFKTVILQRLEPETRLLILHTRWNSHDIIGYLKENQPEDYTFIEYRAIQEDDTPLWPQRYTTGMLNKRREEIGDRMFQALYQQKPIDDTSDFFKLENIHWSRPENLDIEYSVRAWDIAGSDNNRGAINDYTAGALISTLSDHQSILIHDLLHGQYGSDNFDIIRKTAKMDGVDTTVLIETGVAAAGKLLYQMWEEELSGYFVERAMPINSKIDRATSFQGMVYDGRVYIDIHDDNLRGILINELKGFPSAVHDDIIDAIAHGVNYCKQNYLYNPEDEVLIGGTIQL